MGLRILSRTVLLFGLGLVLLPVQVAGQQAVPGETVRDGLPSLPGAPQQPYFDGSRAPSKPAWGSTGTPPKGNVGVLVNPISVIASTFPPDVPTPGGLVPVPDDGLGPLMPAPVPLPVSKTHAPEVSRSEVVQVSATEKTPEPARPGPIPANLEAPAPVRQALYIPGQDTPPGTESTGGIQVVSDKPAAPVGMGRPEAVLPTPTSCSLALDVVGPARVTPGQPLICTILARNPGPTMLAQVRVELPLPLGARVLYAEPAAENIGDRLAWRLGNLEASSERSLKVELQSVDPGEVHLRPVATYALSTGLKTNVVRPAFEVTVSAPTTVVPDSTVGLQIHVANHQTTPVERVIVRAQLPAGLVHPQGSVIEADVGTVGPGEIRTLRLEARANQSGRWVNEVFAYADGMPETRAQAAVVVTDPALNLKIDGPRQTLLHEEQTFQIEVSNPGPHNAEGVQLTQVIPDGLQFADASAGASYNPATQTVSWPVGTLAPSQRQVVTFRARSRLVGDWALAGTATAAKMADAKTTHAIHIETTPVLALEVISHEDPVDLGAETMVEVRAYNQGPAPGNTVRLTIQIPETMLPLRAEGPSTGVIQGQYVTFDPLNQLAPQADAVYRIRVRGLRRGQALLRAELTASAQTKPLSQEITTNVRGTPAAVGVAVESGGSGR